MIPNRFHFIRLGDMPLGLSHYLAIASAQALNRPDAIHLHCDRELSGSYAEKIRPLVRIEKVDAPTEIFGNTLHHPAHQADVLRLRILREQGGVYLDLDTISVKPLTRFLSHPAVIGKQTTVFPWNWKQRIKKCVLERTFSYLRRPLNGLCNGVLLAEPENAFIQAWLESYRTFRSTGLDEYWGEHSGIISWALARQHRKDVRIVSEWAFHYPLFDEDGLKDLFVHDLRFPRAYVHHLWESKSGEKYLNRLTEETIRSVDTTYNRIARRYL
jgi:hypothetical protein